MHTIRLGNHQLIIADAAGERTLELASRAARSAFPVLLCGPSGSGKELFARYIHLHGVRREHPFVSLNCAAIPENLLEAELFGFERGAFTGAVSQRIGKFELASSGTLLLDEISEMHLSLQAKLLRALQESEIDRIGGKTPISIDTRIIATSNREPVSLIQSGRFREDLFYRLNVIRIDCSPLQGRSEAIACLIDAFLKEWSERSGERVPEIEGNALEKFVNYAWPGNIRELKNAIERAIFLSDGRRIRASHLTEVLLPVRDALGLTTLAEIERHYILEALERASGNRTHTANRLGISVRTLRNKLRVYFSDRK